jgi:AraC-like DNA-binding protein
LIDHPGGAVTDTFALAAPWRPRDPLTDALYDVRMRGAFYSWTESTVPVAVRMPTLPDALGFHIAARGNVWLEFDDADPVLLEPGHVAIVPRGLGHVLSSRPGMPILGRADELPQTYLGDHFSVLRIGPEATPEAPAPVAVLCGIVAFDSAEAQEVLTVLPHVIVLSTTEHPNLRALVTLIVDEMVDPRPGGEAVATRLADVLVVEAVRAWLAAEPDGGVGWLTAFRDPALGPVLAAVHREPGRAWTLDDLASGARMSRSTFAARFTSAVGIPAMQYVTEWRMRAARRRLLAGDTVANVAGMFGYGSEAAFSRAYTRVTGETPGRVRRTSRTPITA